VSILEKKSAPAREPRSRAITRSIWNRVFRLRPASRI
jgi:hypothetical protein